VCEGAVIDDDGCCVYEEQGFSGSCCDGSGRRELRSEASRKEEVEEGKVQIFDGRFADVGYGRGERGRGVRGGEGRGPFLQGRAVGDDGSTASEPVSKEAKGTEAIGGRVVGGEAFEEVEEGSLGKRGRHSRRIGAGWDDERWGGNGERVWGVVVGKMHDDGKCAEVHGVVERRCVGCEERGSGMQEGWKVVVVICECW
jgi:hypothetical protein